MWFILIYSSLYANTNIQTHSSAHSLYFCAVAFTSLKLFWKSPKSLRSCQWAAVAVLSQCPPADSYGLLHRPQLKTHRRSFPRRLNMRNWDITSVPWDRLALVFEIVACIPPGSARTVLVNYIFSVGIYQPVTHGTAKESTKLTTFLGFNFMLVLRTVFTVVQFCCLMLGLYIG